MEKCKYFFVFFSSVFYQKYWVVNIWHSLKPLMWWRTIINQFNSEWPWNGCVLVTGYINDGEYINNSIVLYSTVVYCTILFYCIILYCIVLYCTALPCTAELQKRASTQAVIGEHLDFRGAEGVLNLGQNTFYFSSLIEALIPDFCLYLSFLKII